MPQLTSPYQFGRDELGPAVADYLAGLSATCSHFETQRGAKILFASRAGVRIKRALEVYLESQNQQLPETYSLFWISRLMVAKGIWKKRPDLSAELLSKELQGSSFKDAALALFPRQGDKPSLRLPRPFKDMSGANIGEFLLSSSPVLSLVKEHLGEQSDIFDDYISSTLAGATRALIVDTGWQGSAQRLLQEAYNDIDWWGAYFGRAGFVDSDRKYWHKMIGLVFEGDCFDPHKPETCVVEHRHMIESLFEPSGLSVERLARDSKGGVFAPEAKTCLIDAPTIDDDPIFCGVLDFIGNLKSGIGRVNIRRESRAAWTKIAQRTLLPTRDDVAIFSGTMRSADFGRELEVPLVLPSQNRFAGDTPGIRISHAIWKAGQIAMEYPREIAFAMQSKAIKLTHSDQPSIPQSDTIHGTPTDAPAAIVAVITRTMNRPIFLRRALESVGKQTFRDYLHIIVSDGGDIEATRNAINTANIEHSRVVLIDNVVNRGMEAASNIAINSCRSKYIVIHDDDDTWEPNFLHETVSFLEGGKGDVYAGVISKTNYVSEEVTHEGVEIHHISPYQDWVQSVSLGEMLVGNFFAPISFLFRREVYEKVGGYNEAYPVLGDWEFNIRFLMEANIGVVGKPLANYHHRDRGDTNVFGNTVISGASKHAEYAAVVRNNLIRKAYKENNPALATLAGLGTHLEEQRSLLRNLSAGNSPSGGDSEGSMNRKSIRFFDQTWVALYHLFDIAHPKSRRGFTGVSWLLGRLKLAWIVWKAAGATRFDHFVGRMAGPDVIKHSNIHPTMNFDEEAYLRQYPDVATAVKSGGFRSGFEHYYRNGEREGRARPSL